MSVSASTVSSPKTYLYFCFHSSTDADAGPDRNLDLNPSLFTLALTQIPLTSSNPEPDPPNLVTLTLTLT